VVAGESGGGISISHVIPTGVVRLEIQYIAAIFRNIWYTGVSIHKADYYR